MGALSELDANNNNIPPAAKALLQGACDANGVSLSAHNGVFSFWGNNYYRQ
jgi:hypothetical protein